MTTLRRMQRPRGGSRGTLYPALDQKRFVPQAASAIFLVKVEAGRPAPIVGPRLPLDQILEPAPFPIKLSPTRCPPP